VFDAARVECDGNWYHAMEKRLSTPRSYRSNDRERGFGVALRQTVASRHCSFLYSVTVGGAEADQMLLVRRQICADAWAFRGTVCYTQGLPRRDHWALGLETDAVRPPIEQ
jgi:hypothetical protein